MKIAVTGAAGFLGNVLIRQLIHHGHEVLAIDLKQDQKSLENLSIEFISVDIIEQNRLQSILQNNKIEIIFHLANVIRIVKDYDGLMKSINIDGTRSAAAAARLAGARRFIYVSSIHAYSLFIGDKYLDESFESALDSKHFDYDQSKALAELAVKEEIKLGLDAVILNPAGFIGPYDYQPSLMGAALENAFNTNWLLVTLAGGFHCADVRDIANTLIKSIDKARKGENYILSGEYVSLSDMMSMVIQTRGNYAVKLVLPLWLGAIAAQFNLLLFKWLGLEPKFSNQSIVHLQTHRNVSDEKARRELGHTTSL